MYSNGYKFSARTGTLLRNGAIAHVKDLFTGAQATGSVRLFSVRHEFPNEWASFQSHTPGADQRRELKLSLRPEHYPFWSHERLKSVASVEILARVTVEASRIEVADKADTTHKSEIDLLVREEAFGSLFWGKLSRINPPGSPVDPLNLFFGYKGQLLDLWIAVTWSGQQENSGE